MEKTFLFKNGTGVKVGPFLLGCLTVTRDQRGQFENYVLSQWKGEGDKSQGPDPSSATGNMH